MAIAVQPCRFFLQSLHVVMLRFYPYIFLRENANRMEFNYCYDVSFVEEKKESDMSEANLSFRHYFFQRYLIAHAVLSLGMTSHILVNMSIPYFTS